MIKILLVVVSLIVVGLACFGGYTAYVLWSEYTKEGGPY